MTNTNEHQTKYPLHPTQVRILEALSEFTEPVQVFEIRKKLGLSNQYLTTLLQSESMTKFVNLEWRGRSVYYQRSYWSISDEGRDFLLSR